MDPKSVALVQSSFRKVEAISDVAAQIFYTRLFEVAPQVRPLFKNDQKVQGQMLMSALGMAVKGLHKPETIVGAIQQLGARHKDYGVTREHYAIVGGALLYTLELGLGPDFTPEVKEAWTEAYGLLSRLMIEASEKA